MDPAHPHEGKNISEGSSAPARQLAGNTEEPSTGEPTPPSPDAKLAPDQRAVDGLGDGNIPAAVAEGGVETAVMDWTGFDSGGDEEGGADPARAAPGSAGVVAGRATDAGVAVARGPGSAASVGHRIGDAPGVGEASSERRLHSEVVMIAS